MKPEHQVSEQTDLSAEDLETIFKLARHRAEAAQPETEENLDWRTLAYLALGGMILVVLILQLLA